MKPIIKKLISIAVVLMIIPCTLASCGVIEDSTKNIKFDTFTYDVCEAVTSKVIYDDGECYQYDAKILADGKIAR